MVVGRRGGPPAPKARFDLRPNPTLALGLASWPLGGQEAAPGLSKERPGATLNGSGGGFAGPGDGRERPRPAVTLKRRATV